MNIHEVNLTKAFCQYLEYKTEQRSRVWERTVQYVYFKVTEIGEEAALLNNHRSGSTEFLAILALSKNSLIQETGVLLLTVGQTTTSPVCLGLFQDKFGKVTAYMYTESPILINVVRLKSRKPRVSE